MSKFDVSDLAKGLGLTVDGVKYHVNNAGKFLKDGQLVDSKDPALWTKLNQSFGDATVDFAKSKVTNTAQVDAVRQAQQSLFTNLKNMSGDLSSQLGEESLKIFGAAKALEKKLGTVASGTVADAATLKLVKETMLHHPDALHVLPADAYNKIFHDTIDMGGKVTRIIDHAALQNSVTELKSGLASLEKLHETGKYTPEAVKKIFLTHPADLVEHLPTELTTAFTSGKAASHGIPAVAGIDLATVGRAAITEAEGHGTQAVTLAREIISLQNKAQNSLFKGNSANELAQKVTAFEKLSKDFPDSARHINDALKKGLNDAQHTQIKGIAGVSKTFSAIEKAATQPVAGEVKAAGAKLLGGGKWYSFVHDASSVGSKVEKIGKVRWGKAGVVAGVAAVTTAIAAACGLFGGRGEHASRVDAERSAEPAVAGAARA